MDNGNNGGHSILEEIAKTIALLLIIFGLLAGCMVLYLISFMNRIREYEMADASTTTAVETYDVDNLLVGD